MRIFVDTSALLALANPSDGNHERARHCLSELGESELVTSDYVIDEALTRWITTGRAGQGLAFISAWLESPRVSLVFVDRRVFGEALGRVERYADQRLSFTDITNTVLFDSMDADALFAFDQGFERIGYAMIPRRQ